MRVQKRKIVKTANSKVINCYDKKRYPGFRNFVKTLNKCKNCKDNAKVTKDYVYCKRISAPPWRNNTIVDYE